MLSISLCIECLYHSCMHQSVQMMTQTSEAHCLTLAGLSDRTTRGIAAPSQRVERRSRLKISFQGKGSFTPGVPLNFEAKMGRSAKNLLLLVVQGTWPEGNRGPERLLRIWV